MKKRVVTLLLALVMVLSLLPVTAWTAVKTGSVPALIYYSYDSDTKVLRLTSGGPLNDSTYYSHFSSFALLPISEIEKVVFEAEVTELGNYAFKMFTSLKSISIPDAVTRIGAQGFNECRTLESIKMPKNLKKIGDYAFGKCYALKSITIPSKVTEIGAYAFDECDALESITILGPITHIRNNAFWDLDSLKTITFPKQVGAYARIESQAFYDCPQLRSIVIPEGVESIDSSAFGSCDRLGEITLPSTLKYLEDAFSGCPLQTITFAGDAPRIAERAFPHANATAYYPAGNPTWTAEVMQNYGGTITWKPYCTGSHSYGSWTTVDDSSHKRTCSACGKEETAAHSWDNGTTTTAPTCQSTGEALLTCIDCGTTRTEMLPITDHSYSAWSKVDDRTHTHKCSVCSKEESASHSWDEGTILKAANCISDGETRYACTGCGMTRTETVKKTGVHAYDHGCDNDCNVCGATRVTSHKYSADWRSNKSTHWHTCIHCGDKDSVGDHTPGPEPTEEAPQICTVCSYILKPSLRHEHSYTDELASDETGHWYPCHQCSEQKDFLPHTFDNGCDTKCETCGYERMTVHMWSEVWGYDAASHFHACTVCGEKKDGAAHDYRWGTCKSCDAADPNYEPFIPSAPVVLLGAGICGGVTAAVVLLVKKKKKIR